MKPSDVRPRAFAEAVEGALRMLDVSPDEVAVCVLDPTDGSRSILAATPVGLLRMTDKITSRFTAEYRLTTEVTPWHAVSASVTLHTDRGKAFDEPAAQWNMTISAPDEISIDARSSDEGEEFRGIQDFVAAVLRWIEPLRL